MAHHKPHFDYLPRRGTRERKCCCGQVLIGERPTYCWAELGIIIFIRAVRKLSLEDTKFNVITLSWCLSTQFICIFINTIFVCLFINYSIIILIIYNLVSLGVLCFLFLVLKIEHFRFFKKIMVFLKDFI